MVKEKCKEGYDIKRDFGDGLILSNWGRFCLGHFKFILLKMSQTETSPIGQK